MKQKTCPTCSTPIVSEMTDDLCPKCLLRDELAFGDEATQTGSDDAILDTDRPNATSGDVVPEGQRFGDYELLEEIARGGMGVVYRARDTQLNRVVALKMILSGQLAGKQDIDRFKQEAEAAANLDHSGIVPIYEIGEVDGQHFFSMKLIEGGSLSEQMPQLRKDTRKSVVLVEKVARAVHFAHQRGILHRDIKPANILINENDEPVITDLGLAKELQSDSGLTHTGAVVGTPAYMPPEQAAANKEITTAADIYSVGAILYEVLTSSPPHKAESPIETLMQVLDSDIVRPRELDNRVDKKLELICMKCLARDPNERYSSAAALAEDLRCWLNGEPVSVKPRSAVAVLGEAVLSNLRGAIGAALIGIALGLLFAYLLSRGYSNDAILENPPAKIYEQLPGEIPFGRNLVFITEQPVGNARLFFAIGALVLLGTTGWIVASLTRARHGSESFALGLIASIMMSSMLVLFIFGLANLEGVRGSVELLARGALSTEADRNESQRLLFEEYPGLEKLDPESRPTTIAFRIFYDNLYRHPLHMLGAIAGAVVLCMLTCLPTTNLAAKLKQQRDRWLATAGRYLEFAFLVVVLAFLCWFQTLLPTFGGGVPEIIVGRWGLQIGIYSFLITMAVAIYRGAISWKWRLAFYVGGIASLYLAV